MNSKSTLRRVLEIGGIERELRADRDARVETRAQAIASSRRMAVIVSDRARSDFTAPSQFPYTRLASSSESHPNL
jgi:hypothetical protein